MEWMRRCGLLPLWVGGKSHSVNRSSLRIERLAGDRLYSAVVCDPNHVLRRLLPGQRGCGHMQSSAQWRSKVLWALVLKFCVSHFRSGGPDRRRPLCFAQPAQQMATPLLRPSALGFILPVKDDQNITYRLLYKKSRVLESAFLLRYCISWMHYAGYFIRWPN